MKIVTALKNPKTNEKLKKENNLEIVGNDIQYQDGILELLEKKEKIDLIIISEVLPGELKFNKLIEKIKLKNNNIEIIAILKNENEELKNYLISKGVFNIFYNNKITYEELINKINNINNIKKENEINEEIKKIKEIISNNKQKNNKKINIEKIKNKIINKNIFKKLNKKINNKNKIISVVRNKWNWKKYFLFNFIKINKKQKNIINGF